MSTPVYDFLATRRSVKPDRLLAPGPSAGQLEQILTLAVRVPDHKKLAPWRFIIFEGDARARMGDVFASACEAEETEPPSAVRLSFERKRLQRAPTVVAVVSRIIDKAGAPEWEQVLSSGACCYNMCLAANSLGFGACWITEWIAYSPAVALALGLAANERIAGFIYIGTRAETPTDRDRPTLTDLVSRW
jgi:nitroreductase